jgi:hypothetical protein
MCANIHIVRKHDYFSYVLMVRVHTGDAAFYIKQDHFHLNYGSTVPFFNGSTMAKSWRALGVTMILQPRIVPSATIAGSSRRTDG